MHGGKVGIESFPLYLGLAARVGPRIGQAVDSPPEQLHEGLGDLGWKSRPGSVFDGRNGGMGGRGGQVGQGIGAEVEEIG